MYSNNNNVYAPNYYSNFKCIADKCKNSCCIDWDIFIDDETYSKYKKIEYIKKTIDICEDGACFALTNNGKCPHLNLSGLCNIILTHGEDYLSDICKNHPRFYNNINGRIEAGLGIVCEEACRVILKNELPFMLSEVKAPYYKSDIDDFITDFDSLSHRNIIISLIESSELSFESKLSKLKEKYRVFDIHTIDEWIDIFLQLEMLDPNWAHLLKSAKNKKSYKISAHTMLFEKYYERLLIYFIYRHLCMAHSMNNLRARLGFSVFSVEFIKFLFETTVVEEDHDSSAFEALVDLARRYSAEIEYSEENTAELIFEFESLL